MLLYTLLLLFFYYILLLYCCYCYWWISSSAPSLKLFPTLLLLIYCYSIRRFNPYQCAIQSKPAATIVLSNTFIFPLINANPSGTWCNDVYWHEEYLSQRNTAHSFFIQWRRIILQQTLYVIYYLPINWYCYHCLLWLQMMV